MAVERVKAYFKKYGMEERVQAFDVSSATVEFAAALHCEPQRIAKTLSFMVDGHAVLVVTAGDAKIDVLYGTIDEGGDTININMPGGIIQGDEAQEMLSEVTEGKNAGDLSGINQIVSEWKYRLFIICRRYGLFIFNKGI